MQDSVALLLAARSRLADHDDERQVVADLCRSFGIDEADALATVLAARLLSDVPERLGSPFMEPGADVRSRGALERNDVAPIS